MKRFIKAIAGLILIFVLTIAVLEMTSSYKVTKTIHTDAPVITRQQVLIDAPVETVWKVFSNVNNWPSWQQEISTARINGPFQEGTSFDWKSNGLTIHSTLHTVEAYHTVGWSGPAFGSFAIHTWRFTPQGNHTLVQVNESMEGWLVTLLQGRFQSGLDTSIVNWLQALKSTSEKENNQAAL
jgi:uncharacterized protein YndB with AHSA1/START domain